MLYFHRYYYITCHSNQKILLYMRIWILPLLCCFLYFISTTNIQLIGMHKNVRFSEHITFSLLFANNSKGTHYMSTVYVCYVVNIWITFATQVYKSNIFSRAFNNRQIKFNILYPSSKFILTGFFTFYA